jgi:hypothetical protein
MNQAAPVEAHLVALRTIAEARHLLTEVVTSSESFNYRKAKEGLKQLDRLIRELAREEARLRGAAASNAGVNIVPFPTVPAQPQ